MCLCCEWEKDSNVVQYRKNSPLASCGRSCVSSFKLRSRGLGACAVSWLLLRLRSQMLFLESAGASLPVLGVSAPSALITTGTTVDFTFHIFSSSSFTALYFPSFSFSIILLLLSVKGLLHLSQLPSCAVWWPPPCQVDYPPPVYQSGSGSPTWVLWRVIISHWLIGDVLNLRLPAPTQVVVLRVCCTCRHLTPGGSCLRGVFAQPAPRVLSGVVDPGPLLILCLAPVLVLCWLVPLCCVPVFSSHWYEFSISDTSFIFLSYMYI